MRRLIAVDDIAVFADVQAKHAAPLLVRPIAEAALDAMERGLADVFIVSGTRTGSPASADDVQLLAVGHTESLNACGRAVRPPRAATPVEASILAL